MKYSGWKSLQLQSVSTPVRCLAGAVAIFLVGWLYLGNLGCYAIWEDLNKFYIAFSPPFVPASPGKSEKIRAELLWSSGEPRPLEAKTWSPVPGWPKIVKNAICSPNANSTYTNLSLELSDAGSFGASDPWTASVANAYQVGVKATFVDPVWESLSGGQEAVIARTAYLPIRSDMPRFVVRREGLTATGRIVLKIGIENPVGGWKYFYEGEERGAFSDGTQTWNEIVRTQIEPAYGANLQVGMARGYGGTSCVRLVLTMKDQDQKVVKTEVRRIPLQFGN